MIYRAYIEGEMQGKKRARVTRQGRAYTPTETVNAEAWVRQCVLSQIGSPFLVGPLSVELSVDVMIPESWSKKKRAAALAGKIMPIGKPDADNVQKLVFDALNKIVWRDDSQIVSILFCKRYGEKPGATLLVSDRAA